MEIRNLRPSAAGGDSLSPPFPDFESVPEDLLTRVMDYGVAAADLTTSRTAWRIPSMVANQWLLLGYGEVRTNDFARRFGVTRRTVCNALNQLVKAGALIPVERNGSHSPRFIPNLKIVDSTNALFSAVRDD